MEKNLFLFFHQIVFLTVHLNLFHTVSIKEFSKKMVTSRWPYPSPFFTTAQFCDWLMQISLDIFVISSESVDSTEARLAPCSTVQELRDKFTLPLYSSITGPSKVCARATKNSRTCVQRLDNSMTVQPNN